ncbi:hypothetical protein [Paenibacillus thiaminolyticus]|uniref:hypothetical protein n=1 Tax=Paenibacillus thiaminolyticus TaxID=49283 RepID=UPI002542F291|nr:hypothetical protein [Paenibacillus thiaminolyticus]WII36366.1 hypothetical protein O0V01_22265 [Paenibacillus thiaminolyticus]
MPYEAKTDWKYDDLVTEKDMNRIEQGLKDAHIPAHQPLTLNPGLQVVEVENDTPFRMGEVKGRTLVNLLGRAGACDDINAWFQHKEAGSPVFSIENSTIKIVTDIERTRARIARFFPEGTLKTGKFYVAIAKIKCTEVGECGLYLADSLVDRNKTKDWETLYSTLSVSSEKDGYLVVGDAVKANVTTHIDDVRLYEISESEYNAIGSMTPEQVAERYPYLDSMTNLTNPYAIVTGGNLLPPFYEWSTSMNSATYSIANQYEATIHSTDADRSSLFYVDISIIENTDYNLSCDHNAWIGVYRTDGSTVISPYTQDSTIHFNSGNEQVIRLYFSKRTLPVGSYTFKNPMITVGSEPKPFTPQQRSMLAFETELAAHPVDGSNPDTLFMGNDGLPYVLESWNKVVLDGSLNWTMGESLPQGGKQVRVFGLAMGAVPGSGHVTKFDGKYLPQGSTSMDLDKNAVSADGHFYISISNTDSGWGPDYTPTQDEIKIYFMGWRMAENIAGFPPYNGTGTKCWYKINPVSAPQTQQPTQNYPEWTPYRLQYLKAKPTVEPVRNYELGATLSAGSNMVEIGSGIVIREKANPAYVDHINYGASSYFINGATPTPSKLEHRPDRILAVFRNQNKDYWTTIGVSSANISVYGKAQALISAYDYEPTAVYHVTYTMLDPTLTAPFNGTVAANLRGTISDLVRTFRSLESGMSGDVVLTAADVGAATKAEFDDLKKNAVVKNGDSITISAPTISINGENNFVNGYTAMNKTTVFNDTVAAMLTGGGTSGNKKTSIVEFKPEGPLGPRSGWIGMGDPGNPQDIGLSSDAGSLKFHAGNIIDAYAAAGMYINGMNIIGEIQNLKQSGVDAKKAIVDAINAMGGSASTNDSWAVLAQKIRAITTGRKFASGNKTGSYMSTVEVRGLSFRPSKISASWDHFEGGTTVLLSYDQNRVGGSQYVLTHANISYGSAYRYTAEGAELKIFEDGFSFSTRGVQTHSVAWFAVE